MPHGVPTDEEVVAEFRARYLYSGNASKIARELKLDERTGRNIARRLDDCPEFSEDVRKLHAHAMRKHITWRLRVAEGALERFEDDTGGIDVKSFGGEDGTTVITDKRADYGKLVLEAEKNAQSFAKLTEGDKPTDAGAGVVINVYGPEGVEVADNGDTKPETG